MKRISLFFMGLSLSTMLFAGGIVTNTNQSAAWSRMLARDASTDIDAVYFNPAGLTKLAEGFHLSLSNQTIGQTRTISNDLLNKEYKGETFAPVFPSIYAAYKTGKFAFSFGFMGIGGGGTAKFDNGLPSFDMPIAGAAASLASTGVTGYSMNAKLEGSSIYFGYQLGVTYEINDMISVYAGGRYVMANNKYTGSMTDIAFATSAGEVPAGVYMTGVADQATAGATQLYGTATAMDAFSATPLWGLSFDAAIAATAGDPATQGQLTALRDGLTDLGTPNAGTITVQQGQGAYTAYGDGYTAQAAELNAGAAQMGDKELDAEQTGSGFTPILGANLSLMEDKLNIGIKYEFKTELVLTNKTAIDDVGMFPDGEEVNADMPAMLSIGVGYQITDALYATAGFHHYDDTKVGWDNVDDIDNGLIEYAIGLEYALTEQFRLSTGWLGTKTGVKDSYHNDLSYSLSTNTFAFGGAYRVTDMIDINVGGYLVNYKDKTVAYEGYSQTYGKATWAVAVGADFYFGGSK